MGLWVNFRCLTSLRAFFFSMVRCGFLGFFDLLWRCCFRALVQRLSEPSENCCFRVLGQRLSEPSESSWPFSYGQVSSCRPHPDARRSLASGSWPKNLPNRLRVQCRLWHGGETVFLNSNHSFLGWNSYLTFLKMKTWPYWHHRCLEVFSSIISQPPKSRVCIFAGRWRRQKIIFSWEMTLITLIRAILFFVGVASAKATGLLVNISGHTRIGNKEIR